MTRATRERGRGRARVEERKRIGRFDARADAVEARERTRGGINRARGMATMAPSQTPGSHATRAALRRDGAPGAVRGYRFVNGHDVNGDTDAVDQQMAGFVSEAGPFDADPVLKAAEREILSATKAQRRAAAERGALLEHGYGAMLGTGSGSMGNLGMLTASGGSDDDDKASTQSVAYLSGDAASNRSYSPFDVTLDEAAENLLCEFGAPIMDGAIGLIDDEGAEIFVEHNAPPLSSWMSNGNLCGLVAPNDHEPEWASGGGAHGAYAHVPAVIDFGVPGHTEVESIASLRGQYRALFGKDTNSNNRQWILKRLEAFRNGDDFTPPSSRFSSPLSGEDTLMNVGASRFKPQASPKRAAGKRQVKSARSLYDDDAMDEHESPRRGVAAKGRGGKGAKGKRSAEATLPKSAHKKAKSVSDAESNDGDIGKKGSGRAAVKPAGRGKPGENGTGRRSKHHNPWALEEAEALVRGVAQCGGGKWADIKKLGFTAIEHRTAVDLKDKWRNLLRIAMLPQQSVKTVGDKKREIPQELLAKVRELAAKQAKAKAAAESRR